MGQLLGHGKRIIVALIFISATAVVTQIAHTDQEQLYSYISLLMCTTKCDHLGFIDVTVDGEL